MSEVVTNIGGIRAEHLYLVKELLEIIPVSKSHLHKCLKVHDVPCIKMKRRYLYQGKDIIVFLEKLKFHDGMPS